MSSTSSKPSGPETHSAVADGIVEAFLKALATEDGMEALTKRLRQTLLENHSYSEASLRSALFDEGTP